MRTCALMPKTSQSGVSATSRKPSRAPHAQSQVEPISFLRRSCTDGNARPTCNGKQTSHHDNTSLQAGRDAANDAVPPIVHQTLAAPGQPLDLATRALMEPRFGWDFSAVRVHTDSTATESARQLGASGYAVGNHVVFAHGQFSPTTPGGQRLIAHELSHVVQQTVATSATAGPSFKGAVPVFSSVGRSALRMGRQEDAREHEAEQAADTAITTNGSVKLRLQAAGILQREVEPRAHSRRRRPSEADLRYMSRRPSFALDAWPRLDQAARDTVLWGIISNYGLEFAAQFREYANGRRQPNLVTEFTNLSSVTPRSLRARGYRYAGDLNGLATWVHPSGREVVIVPRSQPREEEDDESTPFERRCVNPCLLGSETEAECHECCNRIPESDTRCRRACNISCSMSLLL